MKGIDDFWAYFGTVRKQSRDADGSLSSDIVESSETRRILGRVESAILRSGCVVKVKRVLLVEFERGMGRNCCCKQCAEVYAALESPVRG
jgi:hypothetical protein